MARKVDVVKVKKRIQGELERNPLYAVVADGNRWFCPYCGEMDGARWPEREAAQAELILKHFVRSCPVWEDFRGPLCSVQELTRKKFLRELRTRAKRALVERPEWQFTDIEGRWYCPFCVKETKVAIPTNRTMTETTLNAIIEHVGGCFDYKKNSAKARSVSYIQGVVTKGNKRKRLMGEIRDHLDNNAPVWDQKDATGAWICPYCFEILNHVDITSPLNRRENAPRLITEHLLRTCEKYGDGAPPRQVQSGARAAPKKPEKIPTLKPPPSLLEDDSGLDLLPLEALPEAPATSAWGRDGELAARDHGMTLEGLEGSGEIELIRDEDLPLGLRRGQPAPALSEPAPMTLTLPEPSPPPVPERPFQDTRRWRDDISSELEQLQARLPGAGAGRDPAAPSAAGPGLARSESRIVAVSGDQAFRLPSFPVLSGLEVSAELQAGQASQGDFIDCARLGPFAVFALGSVATRNQDPRLVASMARNLLRIHVSDTKDPAEILHLVNADLFPDLGPKTFVSLLVGYIDPGAGRLSYARAGLFPPVVLRPQSGQMRRLHDFEGAVIGVDRGPMFNKTVSTTKLGLEVGDLFVVHTSGVLDVRNRRREPFGQERFEGVLEKYGKHEAEYLTDKIREKVGLFTRTEQPSSDIAVLVLRREADESPHFSWTE